MSVGDVCNREVVVTKPDTNAAEASRLMREHHVGDLVVVERLGEMNRPLGIITDRDLVVEVLAQGVEPENVTVRDLMVQPLETVPESASILDTLQLMRDKGLRRLPVVNANGGLEGLLTLDDVIDLLAEELSEVVALTIRQRQKEKQERS